MPQLSLKVPDDPEVVSQDCIPQDRHTFEDGLQVAPHEHHHWKNATCQVAYGKEGKEALPDRSLPEVLKESSKGKPGLNRKKIWVWLAIVATTAAVAVAATITAVVLVRKNQTQNSSSPR